MLVKVLSALWGLQLTAQYLLWYEVNLVQSLAWLIVTVVWGALIVTGDLILGFRSKWRRKPIGIITVSVLLVASYLTPYGPEIGAYTKMFRHEKEYSRIVSDVLNGRESGCHDSCIIDDGPPVRVAFSWGGLTDNWGGVCYDPSGSILEVNQSNTGAMRELFGGELTSVKHLWDGWYYCSFT